METTEKIVESYCRYVNNWFTIPNIKCTGQYEIDLLAVDLTNPKEIKRYHIETGVSISGAYSKLTDKDFSTEKLKVRQQVAGQRRTIGYFIERKFGHEHVLAKLKEYGFKKGNYRKVIVTWSATSEAMKIANKRKIIVWDFREMLKEISERFYATKTYFIDDTLRTIQLSQKAFNSLKKKT